MERDVVTKASSYVHCHVHADTSMLDGAARIDDLLAECVRMEMPALAITDHGNMFSAYELWSKARKSGINPIIGMEAYCASKSRHDRKKVALVEGSEPIAYTHVTLLAETTAGMHNLFRLSSLASLEGSYHKPRVDRELLAQYHEGIIATTGCPGGEVPRLLQASRFDAACQAASDYRDIFGPENYFCELMDHGIDIERSTREDTVRLAQRLGLPYLATNDAHYVRQSDARSHDVLLCVQTGARISDADRFRFEGGPEYYLKSPEQMRALFDAEFPDACDNTLAIAERCHVEFIEGRRDLMPRFAMPGVVSSHPA
jgi:DNA polymerase-3 subunit alpha